MRTPRIVGFVLAALVLRPAPGGAEPDRAKDSVVKVYTTARRFSYAAPWTAGEIESSTGSGFAIAERRILTNAHVIEGQTFVQVRRNGEDEKYEAQVSSVDSDADLAILTVDSERFWTNLQPLPIGELPSVQDEVVAYGYPVGGDTLSVTRGVVSRIEHQTYAQSSRDLLAVQIDAAINPGNSGGPVVLAGKVVGVTMQTLEADSVSYMVPAPVVRHYLEDLRDGRVDGVPCLGVLTQPMENAGLQAAKGLGKGQSGVLVQWVIPDGPARDALRPGDVLLSIEGAPISATGTVEFRPRERTHFEWMAERLQAGSTLRLELLREGRQLSASVTVAANRCEDSRVPRAPFAARPRYFVWAGLVFAPVTEGYLKAYGDEWWKDAPSWMLDALDEAPEGADSEIVFLQRVLPAPLNDGYVDLTPERVRSVDGVAPKNLAHLVSLVERATGPWVSFRVGEQGLDEIVIDRQRAIDEGPAILRQYDVSKDRSDDLPRGR